MANGAETMEWGRNYGMGRKQEPITQSIQLLIYSVCETAFSQVSLFLDMLRLSREFPHIDQTSSSFLYIGLLLAKLGVYDMVGEV